MSSMTPDENQSAEAGVAELPVQLIGAAAGSPTGRLSRFLRGCKLGLPIFLGYAPVGAAFGVLARSLGFSVFAATICSATALAGAGQFIALSILATGSGAIAALLATTVVNLRYVLFATTLSPDVAGVRLPVLAWLGFTLTDETFAVNVADVRQRESTPASMAGVGFIAWCGWVLGTIAGAVSAGWIGDPTRFGVDFAMAAMFSALFVALAEDRRHIVVGIVAGVLALALPLLTAAGIPLPSGSFVVIASMLAAGAAAVVFRER